jgi:hypothetical protein
MEILGNLGREMREIHNLAATESLPDAELLMCLFLLKTVAMATHHAPSRLLQHSNCLLLVKQHSTFLLLIKQHSTLLLLVLMHQLKR